MHEEYEIVFGVSPYSFIDWSKTRASAAEPSSPRAWAWSTELNATKVG
jgi:hypothetical protein